MAYKHLLRLRRRIRLGGFGPLGGWYTVEPLNVIRCLQVLPLVGQWIKSLPAEPSQAAAVIGQVGAGMFGPLVSAFVTELVKPRHLRFTTPAQVAAVLFAASECNDFEYIAKALTPAEGGTSESRCGVEVFIMQIAEVLHIDPRHLLMTPMQEVIAYHDALLAGHPTKDEDHQVPFTDQERAMFGSMGMVV